MTGKTVCSVEDVQIFRINQSFIKQPETAAADPETLKGFGTEKTLKEFLVTATFSQRTGLPAEKFIQRVKPPVAPAPGSPVGMPSLHTGCQRKKSLISSG